jgi:hypothetical protein
MTMTFFMAGSVRRESEAMCTKPRAATRAPARRARNG